MSGPPHDILLSDGPAAPDPTPAVIAEATRASLATIGADMRLEALDRARALWPTQLDLDDGGAVWDMLQRKLLRLGDERWAPPIVERWNPSLGAVDGRCIGHPPQVHDPVYGRSRARMATVTRIAVDEDSRGIPVGAMVKRRFFADLPDFNFNVSFAVGPFRGIRPGTYGDPLSGWFNVFTGYYQIDAPKSSWRRPFGYSSAARDAAIHGEELLRLGKADWNYFSNWMYGVPEAEIDPHNALGDALCLHRGRRQVGHRMFDLVDIHGLTAVSAYEAAAPGAAKLRHNALLTPLWRTVYGAPCPRAGYDRSFIPTTLRARLYVAFTEDDRAFRTVLFGGTVNERFAGAANETFLRRQLAACADVLRTHYPALGFSREA